MENNETKFPEPFDCPNGFRSYVMEEAVDWFKKCMEDFPTMYSGIAVIDGLSFQATMELPPEVIYWFNRWFGQFVEGK